MEPEHSKILARIPERRPKHNPKWVKGQSGNPAGKKKGTKNKLTLYREAVLQKQEKKLLDNLPEVLDKVIELARNGDLTATKLFLDRVMAAKKVADEQEERGGREINIVINGASRVRGDQNTIEAEFDVTNTEETS